MKTTLSDPLGARTAPRRPSRLLTRYGPWAVVTGASDGIGRALARELAAAGLNLILVARRASALDALARDLEDRYRIATGCLALDLGGASAVAELADATRDRDVGLLVACAGFGTSGPFLATPLAVESDMLQVNCAAVMQLAHRFGRRFAARGRGGVVLMSSLLAFQGVPRAAHYAATKAYVQVLVEGLHREWKPLGVDVLACAPGPVASGFAARARMRMDKALTPDAIARETLGALGRRATVRPGFLSKFLEASLKLPRGVRVRVLEQVMRGMTRHQEANG
jgi:short-subunit dehydrogenase